MKTLGFAFVFGGLLIAFGSVGGMETTPGYLWQQTLTAISGLVLMFVGTVILKDQD